MTSPTPPANDLSAIRKMLAKATRGPWVLGDGYGASVVFPKVGEEPLAIDLSEEDARFIAWSREGVPALLNEVERLRAALDIAETWIAGATGEEGLERYKRTRDDVLADKQARAALEGKT